MSEGVVGSYVHALSVRSAGHVVVVEESRADEEIIIHCL